MEHRATNSGGLELPVVTFGAWAIGGLFWGGSDDAEAAAAIDAAIDHGIDAIDTAPVYGCGHSETLVGRAVRGKRDRVKLLTKCGLRWDDRSGEFYFTLMNTPSGQPVTVYKNVKPDSIVHECEQSLKRLGVETIDLYQVHWPSGSAPADATMGALVKLNEQGKVRHVGVSNYSGEQLAAALAHGPVVSNQIKYSLLERGIETGALPACRQRGVGVICYSPMAMGLLTGQVTMDREFPPSDVRRSQAWYQPVNRRRVLDALEQVRPIAQARGATLAQLAVAWVLAQPGVTTALVGARNAAQSVQNAGAADVKLTGEELATIRQTFEALGEPAKASA